MSNQVFQNSQNSYWATDDQVEQLDLTRLVQPLVRPDTNTILKMDDQGTGTYPLSSNARATKSSGIVISDTDDISAINSLELVPVAANPGGAETLWINSADGKLYRDGVDLEATGSGDVVGPASSGDNRIALFDGATGKLLKNSNTAAYDTANSIFIKGGNALTSGTVNTSIGNGAQAAITTGSRNSSCGGNNLQAATSANDNSTIGVDSCLILTSGSRNTALGNRTLKAALTGNDNLALGYEAGINYTGAESNNICIDNDGVVGDASTIRIGSVQTKCFVSGIQGVTPALSPQMVTIGTDNELGSQAIPSGGGDVTGPASANNLYFALFDGVTGKLLQNSGSPLIDTATSIYIKGGNISSTGTSNTALGASNMTSVVTGLRNSSLGTNCLNSLTAGNDNVGIGVNSLSALGTGSSNVGIGYETLRSVQTGDGNIALGHQAGFNLSLADSNNIMIGNQGLSGDSQKIKIGTSQTSCIIKGIYGVTPTLTSQMVTVDSAGEMGSAAMHVMSVGEIFAENLATPNVQVSTLAAIAYGALGVTSANWDSPAAGQLRYTGSEAVTVHVACSMSAKLTAGTNEEWHFGLYKNAVLVTGSQYKKEFRSSTAAQTYSFHKVVSMVSNDILTVRSINNGGSNTLDLFNFNLQAVSIN